MLFLHHPARAGRPQIVSGANKGHLEPWDGRAGWARRARQGAGSPRRSAKREGGYDSRSVTSPRRFMHPELQEAVDLHHAIVAEAGNALVGYATEKALANV